MRRLLLLSGVALSAFPSTVAVSAPMYDAMQQLDYPVLAPGDVTTFRVLVPAHPGGQGTMAHAAFAIMPGGGEDLGYRFFAVDCPAGYHANVHDGDRGVVCYRHDGGGHADVVMRVHVRNVGAMDGATHMQSGLVSLVEQVGTVEADWVLYGVR